MCKDFTAILLLLKIMLMYLKFERIEISESIYEVVVELSYLKKLPGQIPTILITAG